MELPERERIGAIYDFVRDEMPFGYNASDDLPASAVLADGYGQCNTKTTLLMALLRAGGIGCRFHGATLDKSLQHGDDRFAVPARAEQHHPQLGRGVRRRPLGRARGRHPRRRLPRRDPDKHLRGWRPVPGYGVGTDDLANPPIQWAGTDTRIQATGVNEDFGVFDDPDTFYRAHGVTPAASRDGCTGTSCARP